MEQVIVGGYYDALNVGATEYNILMGGGLWAADPDDRAQAISTAGKLKNLRVELDGVPGTGTYTFTLHRAVGVGAWANTALTCTVAADGTIASDIVNEVAVAAGDVVSLECAPDSPDNARYARWTMMFEGDNTNESLLLTWGVTSATADNFFPVVGYFCSSNEADVRGVCPTDGVIKNLYVQLDVVPGDAPDGYTFTLRVNGVDSDDGEGNPLQVAIVADNKTGNDAAHEITVSAGDVLTISCVRANTPVQVDVALGMTFVATIDGESLIMGGSYNPLSNTDTEYNNLTGHIGYDWTAIEAERYQLAQECKLKKLYMLLGGVPGAGDKYTFTVRLEGASPGGGLVVEIADVANTGNDTTNSIAVSDGETVNMMVAPTGTPQTVPAYWGLVCYIEPPVVGLENKSANMGSKMVAAGLI